MNRNKTFRTELRFGPWWWNISKLFIIIILLLLLLIMFMNLPPGGLTPSTPPVSADFRGGHHMSPRRLLPAPAGLCAAAAAARTRAPGWTGAAPHRHRRASHETPRERAAVTGHSETRREPPSFTRLSHNATVTRRGSAFLPESWNAAWTFVYCHLQDRSRDCSHVLLL